MKNIKLMVYGRARAASPARARHLNQQPTLVWMVPKSSKKDDKVFYFKGCPRCKGDVLVEKDSFGIYRKCMQCGRIQDLSLTQPGVNRAHTAKLAA